MTVIVTVAKLINSNSTTTMGHAMCDGILGCFERGESFNVGAVCTGLLALIAQSGHVALHELTAMPARIRRGLPYDWSRTL